jgi:hypothetical protein
MLLNNQRHCLMKTKNILYDESNINIFKLTKNYIENEYNTIPHYRIQTTIGSTIICTPYCYLKGIKKDYFFFL